MLESLPGPFGIGALLGAGPRSPQTLETGVGFHLPLFCPSSYSSVCEPQAPPSRSEKEEELISPGSLPRNPAHGGQGKRDSSTGFNNLETSKIPYSPHFQLEVPYPRVSNKINCEIKSTCLFLRQGLGQPRLSSGPL